MPSRRVNHISVVFDPSETDIAELICEAVAKALKLIQESWGLGEPKDCRIHVMTSWRGFFFQSAPWYWRIWLVNTYPFWCFRARRMWPYSAAWTQRYGKRVVIGVKPPWLLEQSDKSIGKLMYEEEQDSNIKVSQLTCHELTHACAAHMKLPAWLNEGLAMLTVDRFIGKPTIRTDTLELLRSYTPRSSPPTYRELSRMDPKGIAYYTTLGYWLVQYLEEVQPGFLKQLFASSTVSRTIEPAIVEILGFQPNTFWRGIPDRIANHYQRM